MASLAIVLSAFVMSSLVGCFTVDRTPFRHPSRWLRILTVLLFMTATASHMLLSALSHLRLPDIAHLILGASLIAPAAIVSGFVFGTFFQAVDESHTRQMPWVLAAGAGGVGLACYQIQRLDFTVLIGLCVLLFALAPADKREPESSPTE